MADTATTMKYIRRHYGVSQSELAQLLNASVRTVQHWEQGDYEPSGTAVKLIQLLAKNDAIFTELSLMKEDEGIMYLEHDDQALTIMGVQFRNEKEYRATMNAVVSNMYEGFEPTLDDIQMARDADDLERPMTAKEVLDRVNARNSVRSE
ncbi:XRE family transcriptional regulator [Levilactobacillus koreensis JCM 16448]|uniref:Transcription regulator, Xre family protein n=1 Tax=Levilactobacillus koreensis TaxID=637971 RepID=A0AAC8UVS7_9LACO|nr:helix-turn-helix domain-containing protein [Levilactobacillus koreensis]AKP64294.1 transcription regulator, Xre family protein [Levilactobacillus koreensis]KRK91091.1 XRE family transcriptional regulator [Levilactobacillus koreensis JCM 16448]